jgi:amidohydrolase
MEHDWDGLAPKLQDLRHELHAHPELSGMERQTAQRIGAFLREQDPDTLLTELGGHGLAAIYAGRTPGPTLLFRAELDALPLTEENDLPYRSRNPEVAHLCGHDGHMASVAGLAALLKQQRPERGRVVLLFQGAEETGAGARRILDDRRFASLAPDWAFALHNLPGEPLARVIVREGPFACGSSGAVVRLVGRAAHAAYPEQARSPALALAELVQELIGLTKRRMPAHWEGIALVTVIHALLGQVAFGMTPGEATIMATIRADREDVLQGLRHQVVRLAEAASRRHGLSCRLSWTDEFPVTVNDPEAVSEILAAASDCGLESGLQPRPFRWSEDFGWFTRGCHGALFGLGSGQDQPALHAPDYDFPDILLLPGLRLFASLINRLLGDPAPPDPA